MVNGPQPVRRRQGQAVVVGDRDQGRLPKAVDDGRQVRRIESIVDRRQVRNAEPVEQWQMHPIDVAVHDVEIGGDLGYRVQLHGIRGERVGPRPAETNRARHDGDECTSGERVAACEQRHVMPECDQLFRQP
jgi:hypothetical protein